ncbi:MAG: DUF4124 domain-containing protein [Proteobacteria bacterium]|nr:DUF4124 domain-containing protein [Pseudomonadota bacterium]
MAFITIKAGSGPVIHCASVEKPSVSDRQVRVSLAKRPVSRVAVLLALFLLSAPDGGAGTFRWVDDQGKIHYTDLVPPEEAKRPHAKLNPNAQTIEVVEGQKTPEQFENIKRLKQLRIDQQRVLAMQKDNDSSLLRTYRSVEEMQMALQNKINTIDSTIKIADSNRQHQEENLRSQVKRAAEMELSGQSVPKNLRDSIESTRRQIATYQEKIRVLENSNREIAKSFEKDLERFKSLENIRLHPEYGSLDWRTQSPYADIGILSVASCKPASCGYAWALAKEYVKLKSNKQLVTETETLLQTVSPRDEKDLALLVVRIAGKTADVLFLDTACHTSSLGDEFCIGESVKNIRSGFAPYIEHGLSVAGY